MNRGTDNRGRGFFSIGTERDGAMTEAIRSKQLK